jgi:PAS domain S-box-containing protein
MRWLFPSVLATLVGVLILCFAYSLIFFREKSAHLGLWTIGWLCYALRLLAMLALLHFGRHPTLFFINQFFALLNAFFLLWGAFRFTGKPFPIAWMAGTVAGAGWIGLAIVRDFSFAWTTIPTFFFMAAVYLWTGVVWLRDVPVPGVGRWLAGWSFILWGLHKADYPFIRPLVELAPIGYLLGASFAMVGALSILLVHFDKVRLQVSESERRMRMVADHLPVLLAEVDADARYRFANREHENWFGRSPAEIQGQAVAEVIGQGAFASFQERIAAVLEGREVSFEGWMHRPDGGERFYEARLVPRFDGEGRVAGCFIMALDMTRRRRAEEALTASMERYGSLLGSISDGFYSLDEDLVITYFNPAAGRLLGRAPEEVVGRPLFDAFPEARGTVFQEKFEEALRERQFLTFETLFEPAPYTNWYEVRVYPHHKGISVFFQVTTERKRNEERIREGEARYRRIVETANEGVWLLDAEGKTVFANRKLTEMLGCAEGEIIGRLPEDFMPAEGRIAHRERMARRRRGLPETYDCRYVRTDGTFIWAHVSAAPEMDMNGEYRGAVGMITDITERVRTEQALRESERRLREAQRLGRIGAWEYDFRNREMVWSEMTSELFRLSPEKEKPSPDRVAELLSPEDRLRLRRRTREVIRTRTSATYDFAIGFPDGETAYLAGFMRPVLDEAGRVVRLVGAVQDISGRKRAEADKAAMERQLLQAQKMEAIGALAGGIAHDFNNILAAMTGFTELALAGLPPDDPARDRLMQVLKAGTRAKELVRQILSFSRRDEQERSPIFLSPVVKEVLNLLRATIPTTIDIRHRVESETGRVLADPTAIHQLLMNLCANAAQAMRDSDGALEVRLETVTLDEAAAARFAVIGPGRYRRLTVRDDGPGIAQEDQIRIFEPFFTTKPPGEGTGLGLSVVHGIVRSHRGEVTVVSEAGKGTTFQIYLPVVSAEEAEERDAPEAAAVGGAERIMLVDDDPAVAEFGREALTHLGYGVRMFSDGAAAWASFAAAPEEVDLLMTDQTMPGMTGLELAGRARALRPELPVLLCTGYSSRVSEAALDEAGLRHLLMKPFTIGRLGEMVRKALGEALQESS